MNSKQTITWQYILGGGGTLLFTSLLGLSIWPVFCTYEYPHKTELMMNMKQIGTGYMIYTDDNNGFLPPFFNQADVRRAVKPYIKNSTLYDSLPENYNEPIQFNLNLTGVKVDDQKGILLADKLNYIPQSEVVMLYSIINKKDEPPAVLTYVDTSTKAIPKGKSFNPAEIFTYQFDPKSTPTK